MALDCRCVFFLGQQALDFRSCKIKYIHICQNWSNLQGYCQRVNNLYDAWTDC
jgi:hypothetical protein